MATGRISKTTEYVKHVFTDSEKIQMGVELAAAYNNLTAIDEEEQVVKAKFKERKSTIEQSVGSLSRDLGNGWTMQNCECRLEYDSPNPFEVSYIRIDNGEVVKTRPMTEAERQIDLPLDAPKTQDELDASIAKSTAAADDFFGPSEEESENSDDDEESEGKPRKGKKK